MINNELKSCPFCGGNAEIVSFNVFCDKAYYCKCTNCEAEIKAPSFSEQEAIESWNKRIANSIPYDERPQGEWIEVKPHQSDLEDGIDYREECSICHEPNRHYGFDEYHDIRFATYYKTNYCPNCGAKMFHVEHTTKKEEEHETM